MTIETDKMTTGNRGETVTLPIFMAFLSRV